MSRMKYIQNLGPMERLLIQFFLCIIRVVEIGVCDSIYCILFFFIISNTFFPSQHLLFLSNALEINAKLVRPPLIIKHHSFTHLIL